MLVITRRPTEKVIVEHGGETLVIELLPRDKKGRAGPFRLGFTGPQSFKVLRSELVDLSAAEERKESA